MTIKIVDVTLLDSDEGKFIAYSPDDDSVGIEVGESEEEAERKIRRKMKHEVEGAVTEAFQAVFKNGGLTDEE
jgi:hypothetical protein